MPAIWQSMPRLRGMLMATSASKKMANRTAPTSAACAGLNVQWHQRCVYSTAHLTEACMVAKGCYSNSIVC